MTRVGHIDHKHFARQIGFEPTLTPLHCYALEERCGTGVQSAHETTALFTELRAHILVFEAYAIVIYFVLLDVLSHLLIATLTSLHHNEIK